MKKTIALLTAAIVLAGCLFTGCKKEEPVPYQAEKELFSTLDRDQVLSLAEKRGYSVDQPEDPDLLCIYNAPCLGYDAQYLYRFSPDAATPDWKPHQISVTLCLFGYSKQDFTVPNDYTPAELNQKIHQVLGDLCRMHGVTLNEDFFIFQGETRLDNTDDDSYALLKDGSAYLEFYLRDADDCFWSTYLQIMPDGSAFLIIEKAMFSESYADKIPNISVG